MNTEGVEEAKKKKWKITPTKIDVEGQEVA